MSHDRYFINKVATRVAAFRDGRLALFDGGYDDYVAAGRPGPAARGASPRREKALGATAGGGRPGGGVPSPPPDGESARRRKRAEAEARNRRGRESRVFRERIAAVEAKILPMETRLKEIEAALAASETYKEPGRARHLGEEKKSIEIELAHLYDAWDEAIADLQREEARVT